MSFNSSSKDTQKEFTESFKQKLTSKESKIKKYSNEEISSIKRKTQLNKLAYYLISFYAGVSSITEFAVSYYFKDTLNIGPSQVSRIMSMVTLPWSLKPFLGLVTDFVPICGYKRKYYIILCGLISMMSWFIMSSINPDLFMTVSLLTCINICAAFSSVLGEAIVVELSKIKVDDYTTDEESQNAAKDYVSLFMIFKYIGVLVASFLKGSLVESIGIKSVFLIGSLMPCLIVFAGFIMIDSNVNSQNANRNNRNLMIGASETGGDEQEQIRNQNIDVTENTEENNEDEYRPSCQEMLNFVTQKKVIVPLAFIILFMSTPSYSDAFFYFLTNELRFTATSLGQISFCSTIGVLFGIFIYKTYFKDTGFKSVLIFCSVLSFFFTFCAYMLVLRVNISYGINDFWLVLFSNSLLSMLGEIMLLPLLSLACVLCPKNMEGTVFSVFMSALNFGGVLSSLSGSWLISYLNITSTDFQNLHSLIFVTNVLSLCPLPILFFISKNYFKH